MGILMPPYPYSLVLPTTPHFLTVRAPIHCVHFILVAGQVHRELAGTNIPYLERCIFRAAHKKPRIWGKRTLVNRCYVPPQGCYESTHP